jgi:hypothetical protein
MSCAFGMDVAEDHFSKLPNKLRRLCIFPILRSCLSIHDARNLLCSVALVSKKSYEQVSCPFFMRDTINMLAQKQKDPDKVIAYQLGMPGAMRYDKMCDKLYILTTDRNLQGDVGRAISCLTSRGAWLNAHYGVYGVSLLAQAVQTAHVSFVSFLIKKGANVNACNFIGQCVRDCNAIYDTKKITGIIQVLIETMWNIESHNRTSPHEYRCVADYISLKFEASTLKNALAIDALLEACDAKSCVKESQHPLLNMLTGNATLLRLFQYLYSDEHKKGSYRLILPQNIQRCLAENDPFLLCENVEY